MVKAILSLLFSLIAAGSCPAQLTLKGAKVSGTIKGNVVDSIKRSPLSFASISVEQISNGETIRSSFTNEEGLFELKELPYKQCKITISSVGYQDKTILLPTFTSSIIFAGQVLLAPKTQFLNEVKVVAKKILIEATVDKLIYNVAADPDSKTITAFEMFRKVPLITLDANDQINLNGNDNFKVLINGRSSSLFVNNISDVFKSMSANTIKAIEVITSPSARYESEGIGGIINVITHKKTINGYNGSANVGATSPPAFTMGGYLTYKSGKVGISSNFSGNTNKSPVTISNSLRLDKVQLNSLQQTGESNNINSFNYFSGEFSYEISEIDLLTASFSRNAGSGKTDFYQHVMLTNNNNSLIQEYINTNNTVNKWAGKDVGLDYQRSSKKNEEQLLTLSYKLNTNDNTDKMQFDLKPLVNYKGQESITNNKEIFKEISLQADYVYPYKKHTIEFGLKSVSRFSNSNFSYKNLDAATGLFFNDSSLGNQFNYDQNIYTAYLSYSIRKVDWSFRAGARIEGTNISAFFNSSGTYTSQNYFNIIPNIAISRKLKRTSFIKFAYNQRIERPGIYFLDPYIDISDPKNIFFGNPELLPATSNVFNLSYASFVKNTSFNVSVFHQFTNNAIVRFTNLGADTISRSTFANIGGDQATGFSASTNSTFYKNLSINLNSTNSFRKFTSVINGKRNTNQGFTTNIFLSTSYRFNDGWRASAHVNYNSSNVLLQGRQASLISHNISVNKTLLTGKKATVSVSITNPLQRTRKGVTELSTSTFYQLQQSQIIVQRVNISLSYRFGKLQDDIARKKRGIKNDDLKTSQLQER